MNRAELNDIQTEQIVGGSLSVKTGLPRGGQALTAVRWTKENGSVTNILLKGGVTAATVQAFLNEHTGYTDAELVQMMYNEGLTLACPTE